ncbi:MAG TPA: hypothetical protein VNN09_13770 [Candidatus Competibacteraceae bacterium]|nr:hypothetical protein [Candidatus Competibacteraceae bacterium]
MKHADNGQIICRPQMSGRRSGWLILGGLGAGVGLYLGWGWLAAVGLLPILISLLPCLAMCVLGLCMSHLGQDRPTNPDALAKTPPPDQAGRLDA